MPDRIKGFDDQAMRWAETATDAEVAAQLREHAIIAGGYTMTAGLLEVAARRLTKDRPNLSYDDVKGMTMALLRHGGYMWPKEAAHDHQGHKQYHGDRSDLECEVTSFFLDGGKIVVEALQKHGTWTEACSREVYDALLALRTPKGEKPSG